MPGKVKTLSQIAAEYDIQPKTLKKWLKPIWHLLQIKNRRSLLPWQVELIYDFLDYPEAME